MGLRLTDPADRLTQALTSPGGTYGYTLDAADNLLGQQSPTGTASSTVNALNQIVQRSGQLRTHDADGNLTGDGQRTYAWDAEQRLVRIGYTGTSRSTTFRYDGLGRRTAVIEQDGTTATETRYLWCGERLCQARDGADTVTRRYYDEGELAVAASGDVANFYAEDHLGSIRDLRLGDGQVLASYDYDPYGNPTRVSETGGVRADYRYAGLVNHAPSGLYLAHYRAYSPNYGRWISRDPIFEAGGINLYAYVENNPILRIDPLGLWTATIGFSRSFQEGVAGASSSASAGFDSSGNVCIQVSTCGRTGPGSSAGGGVDVTVGSGAFCEGDSVSAGMFAEGGTGTFGGGSVDVGADGASGTLSINYGVGRGAAAGSQVCMTKTWCAK